MNRALRIPVALGVIAVATLLTIGLSGVPGRLSSRGIRSSLLRWSVGVVGEAAARDRSGSLVTELQRPASPAWKRFLGDQGNRWTRTAACRYLGARGTPDAIETLFMVLDKHPTNPTAEDALVRVMERHPSARSWARVGTGLVRRDLNRDTAGRLVARLAPLADPVGEELLVGLVGRDEKLDAVLLSALGESPALRKDREVLERVRQLLRSSHASVRREGALAAGRRGDVESFDQLIELLDDEHRGVRSNAHWALTRSTGLRLPADSGRWRSWIQNERGFWESRGEEITGALAGTDPAALATAIRTASEHPWCREWVRDPIERLALTGAPGIRQSACLALGRLRSKDSVPVLLGALTDRDAGVRTAAHQALCLVSDRKLPEDVDECRRALRL